MLDVAKHIQDNRIKDKVLADSKEYKQHRFVAILPMDYYFKILETVF